MMNVPSAFPQGDNFHISPKLIHSMIYDFLWKLGLENTMIVFTAESTVEHSLSLLESGWFLKSITMQSDYHSVLMFLLKQFEMASTRINDMSLVKNSNHGKTTSFGHPSVTRSTEQLSVSSGEHSTTNVAKIKFAARIPDHYSIRREYNQDRVEWKYGPKTVRDARIHRHYVEALYSSGNVD